MALIFRDRVRAKSIVSGTGNVSSFGSVPLYITFDQAQLGTNSFPYAIINSTQFEVGIATYGNGTFYRNLVLSNSNGNGDTNYINFNGVIADVIITNPAELSVLTSISNQNVGIANSTKFIKWVNNEFEFFDPIDTLNTYGSGINSSLIWYNYNTSNFSADPNLKYYSGNLPELYINGVIQATAKSFKIPHPIKENMYLIHGCLEGPEHGIYIRGEIKLNYKKALFLPEYLLSLINDFNIIASHDSFIPFNIKKQSNKVIFKLLIPSFKEVTINYILIGSRNDVEFKMEQ